jgi:nucleotide-binding universal stress UspA family protein
MNAVLRDWQGPLRQQFTAEDAYRVDAIVVPLDGSPGSRMALPVARTLAQYERATLHVAYVGERLLDPQQALQELGLTSEALQGVVLERLTGVPAEAILNFVRRLPASLLVMSTHSAGQQPRATLGPLVDAVLRSAPTRIVLVNPDRGEEPWPIRRVVLAHDGSPTSDFAIPLTADLAHRAGAEVIALHVAARQSSRAMEPGSLPAPFYVDQPQHEWPRWAGEFVERMMALGASPAAVNFKLLVTGGQPGSEIAQFARDHQADLAVVAWHGHWHAQRTGAVKVVVQRAGCPVLLICAPQKAVVSG